MASNQGSDQSDYNKGGMVTFIVSMVASMGIMIYVAFFSGGIDLKEIRDQAPGANQQLAAEPAKVIDVSQVKEPWISSDDMVGAGKALYAQNCAMCHGAEGKGDGIAGGSLNPKPRNLVEGKWKYGGGRLGNMKVLYAGSPGTSMQSYKSMPVNNRWALTHFVNSITENKVADNDADVAAKAPSFEK